MFLFIELEFLTISFLKFLFYIAGRFVVFQGWVSLEFRKSGNQQDRLKHRISMLCFLPPYSVSDPVGSDFHFFPSQFTFFFILNCNVHIFAILSISKNNDSTNYCWSSVSSFFLNNGKSSKIFTSKEIFNQCLL